MNTEKLSEQDDLQLDLLVDDELPETQRTQVLRAMDAAPGRWRALAIRFMQRQVERTAIRQVMGQNTLQRDNAKTPGTLPFPAKAVHQFRMAAAFIVTAGLAAIIALYVQHRQGAATVDQPPQAASLSINVPSQPLTGSNVIEKDINLPVSVLPSQAPDLRRMVNDTPLQNGESRHVVIAPNGNNSAVIFPVTTDTQDNQKVIY